MMGNSPPQANLQPKTKNKLIKEILISDHEIWTLAVK
jgi:hypothetical protein